MINIVAFSNSFFKGELYLVTPVIISFVAQSANFFSRIQHQLYDKNSESDYFFSSSKINGEIVETEESRFS
jgi:hypothetical protein